MNVVFWALKLGLEPRKNRGNLRNAADFEEQAKGLVQPGGDGKSAEKEAIIDFLKVLTGTVDPEYTKPPVLPPSTAKTRKPDEK